MMEQKKRMVDDVPEKSGLKSGLLGEDPNTSLLVSDEGAFYTYEMA